MDQQKNIALLCHPAAGKGKALQLHRKIEAVLQERSICYTAYSGQWPEHFNAFSDVFISGGDGTLNHFINQYTDCVLPIAVFNGGSGNDFAWKLNGNLSFEQQLETALLGEIVPVDAGRCNDKLFLNGVGIGFDGEVVKDMGKKRFISAGHIAYFWTVLKKIGFYKEKMMQLQFEERLVKEKFFMVSIANGSRYGGGFMVAPQATITDGLLDIVTISCIAPFKRILYLPRVEKGLHLDLAFVKTARSRQIIIQSEHILAGHIDGELIETDSFEIEVLPGRFKFRKFENGRI